MHNKDALRSLYALRLKGEDLEVIARVLEEPEIEQLVDYLASTKQNDENFSLSVYNRYTLFV